MPKPRVKMHDSCEFKSKKLVALARSEQVDLERNMK